MAHLACVGSHAINGVAALHTRAAQADRAAATSTGVAPEKFFNVTNGVTPRRWIVLSNPELSALITSRIGDRWVCESRGRARTARAAGRRSRLPAAIGSAVKAANKPRSPGSSRSAPASSSIPQSLFDIQVKRLHEYKRQHLNVLYLVTLYYLRLKRTGGAGATPRTVIFGGKAAPGYRMAKLIIKLDQCRRRRGQSGSRGLRRAQGRVPPGLQRRRTRQHVYPAADLSEQISTAGKEASGTGNMKFAMNGALTIGTLDGANVEIRDAVGPRELLPVRSDGRRKSTRLNAARLRPAQPLRGERGPARGDRSDRQRALLQRRPRAVPAARRVAAARATTTCCSPTTRRTSTASSA